MTTKQTCTDWLKDLLKRWPSIALNHFHELREEEGYTPQELEVAIKKTGAKFEWVRLPNGKYDAGYHVIRAKNFVPTFA
ncbi:MAG: hypothetical protein LBN05_08420 [Oscillospiraceae bacterium]|nr:hypothetical protein [Oscillospiraceae bacterium]